MGVRSVLINLLGEGGGASRALRGVGDEADRAASRVDSLDASNRRASEGGNVFARSLESIAPAAGRAAASIGMVAAQAGAAIPAAAGLAATVVAIAPAAAVAATALVAVGTAGAALKIGMSGVSEAVSAALNPADPAAYAEALAKLSPSARAFVGEVRQLQPAFAAIKAAVQDTLFTGMDKAFANAAKTTLPIFREGLVGAAEALNGMGRNLLMTINNMGKSGELKGLFDGATAGLKNLTKVPAQLLRGFVQLGAAAAPVFARMTKGIGDAVTKVSDKLSKAFSSGALSGAIETAVGLLRQLGQVAANVFKIVSDVFGAAQVSGGGFVGVLQTITGALAQVTGNPAFQQGLQSIFAVMQQLATTAAPLLAQALLAIGPVFAALGPPMQILIQALGEALQPVIAALGPVLVAAAEAVGQLVIALAPLLPVIGQVIAALLPVLVPVLQLMTTVLTALTPVIAIVAQALATYLVPVITTVVGVVTNVVNWFKNLAEQAFPALLGAATGLGPSLTGLKDAFVRLWDSLQPLIDKIGELISDGIQALQPYLPTLGEALKKLAGIFTDTLKLAIDGVTLAIELTAKAIDSLTQFLDGDASASLKTFGQAAQETATSIIESFESLGQKTSPAINQWALGVGQAIIDMADEVYQVMVGLGLKLPGALRAAGAGLKAAASAIGKGVVAALKVIAPEAVWAVTNWIKGASAILSAAVPRLVAIGKSLMAGLVSGIKSMIPSLSGALGAITSMIPEWKGPPEKDAKLLRSAGVAIMDGLIEGIDSQTVKLSRALGEVTQTITRAFGEVAIDLVPIGDLGKKLRQALTKGADEITSVVKEIRTKINDAFKSGAITAGQRDGLVDYLTATNAKLKVLSKERKAVVDKIKEITDYAKKITESVLSYAAITSIKGDDGAAASGGQLVAGLQARLATIREFGGNIKKLAQAGLSKALLRQILDAGIDGGAAIAAELANGPSSIIAALNTAQTQITKVAKGIGLDGADALFGSGKAMGDAFLKGLKSLEKALVDSMELLVEKLLKALTGGVDKAKAKLTELVKASAEINELAVATTKLVPYNPGPQSKDPTPLVKPPAAPKAVPKYVAPPVKNNVLTSNNKGVTVNMGGVTVKDRVDADMLMNAVSFKVRGATF